MSCNAAVRHVGNVAIVELSGRVTLGEGSALVRSTIRDLAKSGQVNILLDLKEVSYMDSAGLGELVGSYASVTSAGGKIKLAERAGQVSEILNVTKLYTVFESFSDETAALASYSA